MLFSNVSNTSLVLINRMYYYYIIIINIKTQNFIIYVKIGVQQLLLDSSVQTKHLWQLIMKVLMNRKRLKHQHKHLSRDVFESILRYPAVFFSFILQGRPSKKRSHAGQSSTTASCLSIFFSMFAIDEIDPSGTDVCFRRR